MPDIDENVAPKNYTFKITAKDQKEITASYYIVISVVIEVKEPVDLSQYDLIKYDLSQEDLPK